MADEVTEGAPEETTETAPANDAPWTADLRGLGLDDETLGKVDGYMREKVQPHTTQLEQQLSEAREAVPEGIQQFYADLNEDPASAIQQLASEVFSENPQAAEIFEVATRYAAANPDASDQEVIQAATETVTGESPEEGFEVELDPEDRDRLSYVDELRNRDADKEYVASLQEMKAEHPDHFPEHWGEEELVKVMSPLVTAAPEEMDDEAALEWAFERYRDSYQLIHAAPGSEEAAAEAAASLSPEQIAAINAQAGGPPVLTGQNASVPSEKDYGGDLGAAVRDFAAEQAAKRAAPPVV